MRYGGYLHEYPKPWKLLYGREDSEPRPIEIYSTVWPTFGPALGANGHHHVDIQEKDNAIWQDRFDNGDWGLPWKWNEDREMREAIKGRWEMNTELISKREVVKWAVGILKEWNVLKNKHYKIKWDLDEDDPNANSVLGKELRNREKHGE